LELHDIYCLLMNRVIKRHALSFKCDWKYAFIHWPGQKVLA
jgi:hypothetical protein